MNNMIIMAGIIVLAVLVAAMVMLQKKNGRDESEENAPAGNTLQGGTRSEEKCDAEDSCTAKNMEKAGVESRAEEKTESIGTKSRTEDSAEESRAKENSEAAAKKREEKQLREELYRYFNHGLQVMYTFYNNEQWERLETLGEISPALYEKKEEILESLPAASKKMGEAYLSCIAFREEDGKEKGYIRDREELQKMFLSCMMPFYPMYRTLFKEGGLRHMALLAPETLRLFHQLTGKNFRPGYRNRYKSGVHAFEWTKNQYRVYAESGKLLCDAVFEDGKIVSGFGQKRERDEKNPDWDIVFEGEWKDGVFESSRERYEYRKPVE